MDKFVCTEIQKQQSLQTNTSLLNKHCYCSYFLFYVSYFLSIFSILHHK